MKFIHRCWPISFAFKKKNKSKDVIYFCYLFFFIVLKDKFITFYKSKGSKGSLFIVVKIDFHVPKIKNDLFKL